MATRNSFPLTFDVAFVSGTQATVTRPPAKLSAAVEAIEAEVTSIDDVDIESHGQAQITAVVTFTP